MRILAITCTFLTMTAARANDPAAQVGAELANRVQSLEERVARLEGKAPHAAHAAAPAKRTYGEAYALALETGRPLVVWSGSAVCPACVHQTEDEFVSFVGTIPELTPNAMTVAVPEDGRMVKIGVVTEWVTSDPVRGHVPSLRRALSRWRDRRQTSFATTTYNAPAMGYGGGMMMSGGGCASCGSSGRGLFGRR